MFVGFINFHLRLTIIIIIIIRRRLLGSRASTLFTSSLHSHTTFLRRI